MMQKNVVCVYNVVRNNALHAVTEFLFMYLNEGIVYNCANKINYLKLKLNNIRKTNSLIVL